MGKQLKGYGKLLHAKLTAFGVPASAATTILTNQQITHRWGQGKRDVQVLQISDFLFRGKSALERAEHIARVFHNFDRSYHVDTTRLAMTARA